MREQEDTYYTTVDYIDCYHSSVEHLHQPVDDSLIDNYCRQKMVAWCYKVVEFVKSRRVYVNVTFHLLDRYLSSEHTHVVNALINRREYQLVIMTSLYIIIKMNEPSKMSIQLLVDSSCGGYADTEFKTMELRILDALDWRLCGPIAPDFCEYFWSLIEFPEKIPAFDLLQELTTYQLEIALNSHVFLGCKPSTLAVAAVLNSILKVPADQMSMEDIEVVLLSIAKATRIDVMSCEVETIQTEMLNCVDKWLDSESESSNSTDTTTPYSLFRMKSADLEKSAKNEDEASQDISTLSGDHDEEESLKGIDVDETDEIESHSPTCVSQLMESIDDSLLKVSTLSRIEKEESSDREQLEI